MIPIIATAEDIKQAIESLPYVAPVERVSIAKECRKTIHDLVALGKLDSLEALRFERALEIYPR